MKNIPLLPFFSLVVIAFLLPISASAYIGPGMGAGAIATVVGILMSIFLALFAILWYPLKRLLKKKKKLKDNDAKTAVKAE